MIHSKRHGEILRLLKEEGTVTIASLADRLGVSLETVRRDVKPLTGNGSVLKMHGAIGLPSMAGEAPFERRMRDNAEAKRLIARMVAATIRDGESVMLDTGTTTSFLARELLGHRRLTVVTNSSDIARTLATVNGNKVYMAGGELRSDSGAAFGASAIDFVSRFSVSHAVISIGAVDAARGWRTMIWRRRSSPAWCCRAASARWSSPTTPNSAARGWSRSAALTVFPNSPQTSRRRATLPLPWRRLVHALPSQPLSEF